ncbi:hypothetical protein MTR67_052134 [Solanum verrucosum]|uniref:Uncharacterized protein n=1 Tax=Solanum verrucosum TaxID=315347 RepID=A0AAF0V7G6_SOLVR|nr:hypothetical protein MTR67_052134 [Solanum verrucosum]
MDKEYDLMVTRQDYPQMKINPTTVTTDGDARSYEFPQVKLKGTDSSIGKMPEPASPMFLINPLTANTGHHSGEASNNISARMADGEDDEGSPEDQAAFIGKLCTFYREKAMSCHVLHAKLCRSVIRLGGYDRGSGYQISASGRAVRDSTRCRQGWQEQHLLGYGEVAEPIVKDMTANNTPKRAKSLKISGKIVRQFFANLTSSYICIIELFSPHHFPI